MEMNPIEYPNLTLDSYEDDEQAKILSREVIDLHYDENGHILRGKWKGEHIDDMRRRIVVGHFQAGREVSDETYISFPWWRGFKLTRYVRIVVG